MSIFLQVVAAVVPPLQLLLVAVAVQVVAFKQLFIYQLIKPLQSVLVVER
jgi:hypothetical protein